jgi:hypothetical protein
MGIFSWLVRDHLHVWGGVPEQEDTTPRIECLADVIVERRVPEQVLCNPDMIKRSWHMKIIPVLK